MLIFSIYSAKVSFTLYTSKKLGLLNIYTLPLFALYFNNTALIFLFTKSLFAVIILNVIKER